MLTRAIGCDKCVLVNGYAGASFTNTNFGRICNFCKDFKKRTFLGEKELVEALSLGINEKVGVTVSGGKDSLYVWLSLVKIFGSKKVIAFNHERDRLTHFLAEKNLKNAEKKLGSKLIQLIDYEFLSRFRNNLRAFLEKPDAAMIGVICTGCRLGISGKLFQKASEFGIKKIINGSSYLEIAPFKGELLIIKGNGDKDRGFLLGLAENPLYYFPGNLATIWVDIEHRHANISEGQSKRLYPNVTYLDYFDYFPNNPKKIAEEVKRELSWKAPEKHSWHFDCLIEPFKNLFSYGLLGYAEIDYKLAEMVRYNLITREIALKKLQSERQRIIESKEDIFKLLKKIDCDDLLPKINKFINQSKYLT